MVSPRRRVAALLIDFLLLASLWGVLSSVVLAREIDSVGEDSLVGWPAGTLITLAITAVAAIAYGAVARGRTFGRRALGITGDGSVAALREED
ncbi:RDD family protein [Streptomyces sp. NPDC096033]|uniref:RDD family protein n=1 Tax=Streptomyces sp. NPDC096033 TaxID=3366071 RepID=UPI00381492E1